jgi:hypothetical protein
MMSNTNELIGIASILDKVADAYHEAITLDLACEQELAKALRQVMTEANWLLDEREALVGTEIVNLTGEVLGVIKEVRPDGFGSGDIYAHYETPTGGSDCMCVSDIMDSADHFLRLHGSDKWEAWALAELLRWHGKRQEDAAQSELALQP